MVDDGKDRLEIAEECGDLLAGSGLDPVGAADLFPPAADSVDGRDVIGDALLGGRDGKFLGREDATGGDGRPEPPNADPLAGIPGQAITQKKRATVAPVAPPGASTGTSGGMSRSRKDPTMS